MEKKYPFLPSAEDNIYVGNQGSFQGYDRPKSLKQVVTAPLTVIKRCALSQKVWQAKESSSLLNGNEC